MMVIGSLAAHLCEHKSSITQLALSPDHNFFVSASDDGTVKIWDTRRFERNVTTRSRVSTRPKPGSV